MQYLPSYCHKAVFTELPFKLKRQPASISNMMWTKPQHASSSCDSVTSVDSSLRALYLCYIIICQLIRERFFGYF